MVDKQKNHQAKARLLEESLYLQVVEELAAGHRRDGLWAKAIVNTDGDEQKAKALYIKYRVQSILDEAAVEAEKEAELEEVKQQEEMRQKAEEDHAARQKMAREKEVARQKQIISKYKSRVDTIASILDSNGAELKACEGYWEVYEPQGGCLQFTSIDDLESYAKSRRLYF